MIKKNYCIFFMIRKPNSRHSELKGKIGRIWKSGGRYNETISSEGRRGWEIRSGSDFLEKGMKDGEENGGIG